MNNSDERDYAEESENARIDRDDECAHAWVSGMMHVHPEDVATVARERAKAGESLPECEKCEAVYEL